MADTFQRVASADVWRISHLNQIMEAWEGVADKGVPLQCTQVNSRDKYAGEFTNRHANGYHFRVRAGDGTTVAEAVLTGWRFAQNVTMDEYATIDGVDLSQHVHSGDAGDAPQLTASSYGDGTIVAAKIYDHQIGLEKLLYGIPKFVQHQGSSATDWSQAGSSNHTPATCVIMQAGGVALTVADGATSATETITFPTEYDYPPLVVAGIQGVVRTETEGGTLSYATATVTAYTVTAAGCVLRVYFAEAVQPATIQVNWFAVGLYTLLAER